MERLAVVGGDGRFDVEGWPGARVRVFKARRYGGNGPLRSFERSIRSGGVDRVLVLACDLPFVSSAFVAHLLEANPEADAVVPQTADGWHPLCGVYHRRVATHFRARIDGGALRITDALDGLDVHAIVPEEVARFDPDGRLLLNVNTPDDYRRACYNVPARPVDHTQS